MVPILRLSSLCAFQARTQFALRLDLGITATQEEIIRPTVQLLDAPFKTRYFAPENLRAAAEDEKYMQLIAHYVQRNIHYDTAAV